MSASVGKVGAANRRKYMESEKKKKGESQSALIQYGSLVQSNKRYDPVCFCSLTSSCPVGESFQRCRLLLLLFGPLSHTNHDGEMVHIGLVKVLRDEDHSCRLRRL